MSINTRPVYFDHNATTPVDARVLEEMTPYFCNKPGNPSSVDHIHGWEAHGAVEDARARLSQLVNCDPSEVVFTSGATEADNLAIFGTILSGNPRNAHIITASTEHKAILKPFEHLEKLGAEVTRLPVDSLGLVNPSDLESSIRVNTVLVSIMTANNEVGTIAPIRELVTVAHERGVVFHTDAAQAVGHVEVDMVKTDVDMLSLSGHKMYGPKGAGALIIRRRHPRIKIEPLILGGGHERGMRSGTLNVPCIVGLGAAAAIAQSCYEEEANRLCQLRNDLLHHLSEKLEGVHMNGHPYERLPHNLNISILGVQNKALQHALRNEFSFSSGSACETGSVELSHVLRALGHDEERITSSIRIGLGRSNTREEVERLAVRLIEESERLRGLSR